MVESLTTVEQVVDKLGGNLAVAAITGAKHTSAISNWKRLGKFPAKTHKIMKDALQERSFDAPDDLWSIVHEGRVA